MIQTANSTKAPALEPILNETKMDVYCQCSLCVENECVWQWWSVYMNDVLKRYFI